MSDSDSVNELNRNKINPDRMEEGSTNLDLNTNDQADNGKGNHAESIEGTKNATQPTNEKSDNGEEDKLTYPSPRSIAASGEEIPVHRNEQHSVLTDSVEKGDNSYHYSNGSLKSGLQTSCIENTQEITNDKGSTGTTPNDQINEDSNEITEKSKEEDDDDDSFFDDIETLKNIAESEKQGLSHYANHEEEQQAVIAIAGDEEANEGKNVLDDSKQNNYEDDFEDENDKEDPKTKEQTVDSENSPSDHQKMDDTLEEIEPLTTAEEPPKETINETKKENNEEQVDNESDKTKSEMDKSTDDNARADEMTKAEGDDTDVEAEDIKSDNTVTEKSDNLPSSASEHSKAGSREEKNSGSETAPENGDKKRKRHSHEKSHQHDKEPRRKVTFETPGKSKGQVDSVSEAKQKRDSAPNDISESSHSEKPELGNEKDKEKASKEENKDVNNAEAKDDVDLSSRTVDSVDPAESNAPFVHETVEERVFMTANDEENDSKSKKKTELESEQNENTSDKVTEEEESRVEKKDVAKEQKMEESSSNEDPSTVLESGDRTDAKDNTAKSEEVVDATDVSEKVSEEKTIEETETIQDSPAKGNTEEAKVEEEQTVFDEPEPEPEPIKITRNVNIDDAVSTISGMEDKLTDLLADMKVLMEYYQDRLTNQHLSEFVDDLDKFRGDFQSLRDAYQKCESLFSYFNKSLKDLRGAGEQMNSLMDRKFREEDLEMWIESEEAFHDDKSKLKEERVAIEKSALAKATEAKAAVARASVAITEASLFAAEAEAAAGEAIGTAKKAWECAEIAKLEAEEARKAAIEKKKVEEEARKRAEERSKKKAEEERLRQEEEDKKLKETALVKGTSFEDEKRKAQAEKARREAERKNPKNWPRFVYSIEPGDFDPGVACVIRAIEGSMTRDDVEVTKISQLSGTLSLVENEELISNIIEIKAKDPEKKLTFEEPISIALPHCIQRTVIGREPVIKQLQPTGRWTELPTSDVVFDDIRELKFVEIRSRRFGIFAVVLKLRKDILTLSKRGNKVNSTVDARVSFTCKPGTFKNNVNFTCEVQPVDSSVVNDLSSARADCSSLLASSPIVRTHIPNRKLSKTLVVAFPLPTAQGKLKRPHTAAPVKKESGDKDTRPVSERPLTSFSTREEEPEEELHLVCRADRGTWTILPKVSVFQPKNKDIVLFEIDEPHDRFIVLKTKEGIPPLTIERLAAAVENAVLHRNVRLILRQKSHDPTEVNVSCVSSQKVDKALKRLADEGYDDGPPPSKEIVMQEGQVLEVRFRGNVQCTSEEKRPKLVFNTYIRSRVKFSVEEIDKFAQKSFDFYRGFAQIFTMMEIPQTAGKQGGAAQKSTTDTTEEYTLLQELLINIPKPEPEPPKPLVTAPVRINGEGPTKEDIFEYVATELGDEWKKLAQYLCLKTVRIQAILRQNNQNPDPKRVRYDMLVTWAKRIPRCVNKLEMLAQALMACGRGDIALELRERDQEYRRQRAIHFRDAYLRRAFVKVAQNQDAVHGWKTIATSLGVPETEVVEIDQSRPSVQEKCFQSLKRWQDKSGDSATLPILAEQLKTCKYKQLAKDIEAIGIC